MKTPNKRPGVDAGWPVLFTYLRPRSRATQAERWADMTRIAVVLLVGSLLVGCASLQPPIPAAARAAMAQVHLGMSESEVVALMRPVATDWGRKTFGASGSGRLYFQLSPTQQVWYSFGGYLEGFKLFDIGKPEPKTEWTRERGTDGLHRLLDVEGMQW